MTPAERTIHQIDTCLWIVEEAEEQPTAAQLDSVLRSWDRAGWSTDEMEWQDLAVLAGDQRIDLPTLAGALKECRTAAQAHAEV